MQKCREISGLDEWHERCWTEFMGNFEADPASPTSPMQATENVTVSGAASPMPDPRSAQNTPLWMEGPASAPPAVRRGHSPAGSRSGLPTILFFGIIIVVVGAAGAFGVALWGPDKRIKNRTQFATNPPAPMELPSRRSPMSLPRRLPKILRPPPPHPLLPTPKLPRLLRRLRPRRRESGLPEGPARRLADRGAAIAFCDHRARAASSLS